MSDDAADVRLDPRVHAYRPDLADVRLEGRVKAKRFVPGTAGQIVRPAVPVRGRPEMAAVLVTEALMGEEVMIFDEADGWAWVQLSQDRYVGYVPAAAVVRDVMQPTHRVRALGTFVYPAATMKAPPLMHLSINAGLVITGEEGEFYKTSFGGFVFQRHLSERAKGVRDFVSIAEQLIGTPYLWGGKTRIGLDCSGLVQTALHAAGRPCPRDSDMQRETLGDALEVPATLEGLQRGDLVFWKGHVGIMSDGVMMVHANAHHMSVVVETLPEAAERIVRAGGPITAIRRMDLTANASEPSPETTTPVS